MILEECTRLELLLTTLTEFIRLAKPDPRPALLANVIDEIEPVLKELTLERGLNYAISLQEGINGKEKVLVDMDAFKKAIKSGLLNAIESYEEKGRTDGTGIIELRRGPLCLS
ncbi:MAG: hypothetical protein ACUVQ6_01980 [Dissulfurimicrobium sp.]|uniref:hypothetical protein n=1 Tax=Dissulfurimicrobium sp. TaxID=2022436 RepID=UPI00404AFED6